MSAAEVVTLVRRCAWCDRLWTSDGWQATPGEPEHDSETSTICVDCADALATLGRNAARPNDDEVRLEREHRLHIGRQQKQPTQSGNDAVTN